MMRGANCVLLTVLLLASLFAGAAYAAEIPTRSFVASILTNTGLQLSGRLVGLANHIRLDASTLVPRLTPDQLVLLPTETVNQIAFDFPRMVIETDQAVYLSPYAISSGIAQELVLERDMDRLVLPVTSLKAIALHGTAVHQPPRIWVGDGFYSMPRLIPTAPKVVTVAYVEPAPAVVEKPLVREAETVRPVIERREVEAATEPAPAEDEDDEILLASAWDQSSTPPSSLPSREMPDWLGIVIVLGLLVATYILI